MQNSEELTANEGDEKLEVTSVFAVATEGRLRRQLESWRLGQLQKVSGCGVLRFWMGGQLEEGWSALQNALYP